jgi:hypothetical protein
MGHRARTAGVPVRRGPQSIPDAPSRSQPLAGTGLSRSARCTAIRRIGFDGSDTLVIGSDSPIVGPARYLRLHDAGLVDGSPTIFFNIEGWVVFNPDGTVNTANLLKRTLCSRGITADGFCV